MLLRFKLLFKQIKKMLKELFAKKELTDVKEPESRRRIDIINELRSVDAARKQKMHDK